jgi:hypothetical protein
MNDVRIFKLGMGVILMVLAVIVVRHNLEGQRQRQALPLGQFNQPIPAPPLDALPPPLPGEPVPGPELTPEEVVRAQLEALRRNDASDRGIATCFRFASPQNKSQTGPLPRFAQMVRTPVYQPMLEYASADYEPLERAGRQARQIVNLHNDAGETASFLFLLQRQQEPEVQDWWMTEGVIRVPPPDQRREAAPPGEGDGPAPQPGVRI